jgi:WD40 repeat protein
MVFDVISNSRLSTIVDSPSGLMSVAVSPDGKLLATGEINQQVRLWKLPGLELSTTLHGYFGPVLSVAYSPDGKLLASTAGGREARLLNLDNPTNSFTLIDPAKPTSEQRSAEAIVSILSIAGMARTIQLTGAPSGAPISGFSYPQWPSFNCPLTFSPDSRFLALIRFSHELRSEYHVEIYDVASGACVSRYSGGISALAFSPDGRRLAVSGIIRIILLDPLTGQEVSVDK